MKSVCIQSFFDLCFPAFALNTERYGAFWDTEVFVKIVYGFGPLAIFTKSCILDVWHGSEYVSVNDAIWVQRTTKNGKLSKKQYQKPQPVSYLARISLLHKLKKTLSYTSSKWESVLSAEFVSFWKISRPRKVSKATVLYLVFPLLVLSLKINFYGAVS